MTCIVGLVNKGKTYIGGDSCGVDSNSLGVVTRSDPKVFRNGPYVIGFCGSFRMGQILMYADLPVPETWDLDRFMTIDFINAVRKAAEDAGFTGKDTVGRETLGSFLVGYKDRLYIIEEDLQVGKHLGGYAALGCGQDFAYGSMFSFLEKGFPDNNMDDPQHIVLTALKSAEEFSGGVRGPFLIMETE